MFHTRWQLEALGIVTGGVGENQEDARSLRVLERKGIRFGFLCYAEDSNYTLGNLGPSYAYYSLETVLEDIEANRDCVDVIVVSFHGDQENMETPSPPRAGGLPHIGPRWGWNHPGPSPPRAPGCRNVRGLR